MIIEFNKPEFKEFIFLSNFYHSPFMDSSGVLWQTNEHYYQAMKTVDLLERALVWAAKTPKDSKRLGRQVAKREDWENIKEDVMMNGLRMKFTLGSKMAQYLIATSDNEIIEHAPWDNYWGSGKDGKGENRLGALLMEHRANLNSAMAGEHGVFQ